MWKHLREKIYVEWIPQDALRCGLSGVTSFVRSDVAKVVYAEMSPSSPASGDGDILFNPTLC